MTLAAAIVGLLALAFTNAPEHVHAVPAAAGPVVMPHAFSADSVTINVKVPGSPFPIGVSGKLNYDYDAQVQRITMSQFGFNQIEVDRYDKSLRYVWATAFGHTECNTCFLKPPLFPYYVPPGSTLTASGVTKNGKVCDQYSWGVRDLGLNATFWTYQQVAEHLLAGAEFQVGYNSLFTVTFEIGFVGVHPGPQDKALFDPPPGDVCPAPRCAGSIDVGLLFDGSGSIASADFDKAKEFGVAVVDAFQLPPAEVAVTQFASTVGRVTALSSNNATVIKAIQSMDQLKSGTNTAAGIAALGQDLLAGKAGSKVMLIITDGQHNQGGDPVAAAATAKGQGIEVFAVGVGSGIDKAELSGMASDPKGLHVFEVSNYAALKNITSTIVSTSCPSDEACTLDPNANAEPARAARANAQHVASVVRSRLAAAMATNNMTTKD